MGLALRGGIKPNVVASAAVDDAPAHVKVIRDEAGMAALEGEWNALFGACERPSPCASFAWASAWWQAYGRSAEGAGEETELVVFVFRDAEGRLVGVVPCVEDRPTSALQVRRLRMLGQAWRRGVFDMTEEPSLLAA